MSFINFFNGKLLLLPFTDGKCGPVMTRTTAWKEHNFTPNIKDKLPTIVLLVKTKPFKFYGNNCALPGNTFSPGNFPTWFLPVAMTVFVKRGEKEIGVWGQQTGGFFIVSGWSIRELRISHSIKHVVSREWVLFSPPPLLRGVHPKCSSN